MWYTCQLCLAVWAYSVEYAYLTNTVGKKMGHNTVSWSHSIVAILFCSYYLLSESEHDKDILIQLIRVISCGYYLHDLWVYIPKGNVTFIAHHIGTWYMLYLLGSTPDDRLIVAGFLLCEITNQPMYVAYSKIALGEQPAPTTLVLEFMCYSIVRPYYGINLIIRAQTLEVTVMTIAICAVSIMWGIRALKV